MRTASSPLLFPVLWATEVPVLIVFVVLVHKEDQDCVKLAVMSRLLLRGDEGLQAGSLWTARSGTLWITQSYIQSMHEAFFSGGAAGVKPCCQLYKSHIFSLLIATLPSCLAQDASTILHHSLFFSASIWKYHRIATFWHYPISEQEVLF